MNQTTPNAKNKSKLKPIVALLAGVAVTYFIVTFVVNQRLAELQLQTQVLISEQETLLAAIAERTARNGGDAITERIIKDCTLVERTRFDSLLGRLNDGLPQSQLVELERLFGRCGNFFSERKAVMVSRLQREIEIYETFVRQLDNLTDSDSLAQYNVKEWNELAALEAKQSQLFSDLVAAQDEIIASLLVGNSPDSEEVSSILRVATEIQETLMVTNAQASNIRSQLVSL